MLMSVMIIESDIRTVTSDSNETAVKSGARNLLAMITRLWREPSPERRNFRTLWGGLRMRGHFSPSGCVQGLAADFSLVNQTLLFPAIAPHTLKKNVEWA